MLARIVLILTLLVQHLSFGAAVQMQGPVGHDEMSCCSMVETTTCCGETIVEIMCGMSDGPCECVMESAPTRAPIPPAPAPTRTDSTARAIANLHFSSNFILAPNTLKTCVWQPRERIYAAATHNQKLSLLGVWRT